MGGPICWWWSVWAGCSGPTTDAAPTSAAEQGVVVATRAADGSLVRDGLAFLGGYSAADPDSSGFAFYVDVPPGRVPVSYELPGSAIAFATPEVRVGSMSAVSLVPHGLGLVGVPDPHVPLDLVGDGFEVHAPADAIADRDGAILDVPWTLGHDRVRADDRIGLPGDLMVIRNDVDVSRFMVDELLVLRGTVEDGTDVNVAEDAELSVVVDLDPGSPVLVPGAEVRAYSYSASRTYWTVAGTPVVDPVARTATIEAGSLGWLALGREPERGCVRGVLVDDHGDPVDGAEVTLAQLGTIGVDRVTTENGGFCLPIDPGAAGDLRALGVAADRSALYTWSGSAAGGSIGDCGSAACVELGEVQAQVWADADGDRSWSGPGGDCDDADPAVSPNPASGDGSYCGWTL